MRFIFSIIFVLACCAPPAMADEPSRVRHKLPVVETNGKGEKCLDVQEWKQVILIAAEYKRQFEWRLSVEPAILELQAQETAYVKLIAGYQHQIDYLESERDSLRLHLHNSEKLKLKLQRGHRIEKGFMWALIVIETLAVGFLGIRSAVVK